MLKLLVMLTLCFSSVAQEIASDYPITNETKHKIKNHCEVALAQLNTFAKAENIPVIRSTIPTTVNISMDPSGIAKKLNLPKYEFGKLVVARMNFNTGTIYLSRRTPEDLYVELGKWFFYPPDYEWGKNRLEDIKMLHLCERFARHCLRYTNKKGLWE